MLRLAGADIRIRFRLVCTESDGALVRLEVRCVLFLLGLLLLTGAWQMSTVRTVAQTIDAVAAAEVQLAGGQSACDLVDTTGMLRTRSRLVRLVAVWRGEKDPL